MSQRRPRYRYPDRVKYSDTRCWSSGAPAANTDHRERPHTPTRPIGIRSPPLAKGPVDAYVIGGRCLPPAGPIPGVEGRRSELTLRAPPTAAPGLARPSRPVCHSGPATDRPPGRPTSASQHAARSGRPEAALRRLSFPKPKDSLAPLRRDEPNRLATGLTRDACGNTPSTRLRS